MLQILELIGYIGNDATINQVNGKSVLNFSVAYAEKYKNASGVNVEKTLWHDCSFWDVSNLAPYLKKGTLVYLSGNCEPYVYITKVGESKAGLKVRVNNLKLLSNGQTNGTN